MTRVKKLLRWIMWHLPPDPLVCVCCDRPLSEIQDRGTRWGTIGRGFTVCVEHGDWPSWPHLEWEKNYAGTVPLAHWHRRELFSWAVNHKDMAAALGIPACYPTWMQS